MYIVISFCLPLYIYIYIYIRTCSMTTFLNETGWRKQHVQNVMGHELYVRLLDADLRESTTKLAVYLGL